MKQILFSEKPSPSGPGLIEPASFESSCACSYRAVGVITIALLCVSASAETFVLRNGIVVSGKLQSMDAQDVGIERCGRVEHFAREDVKSINLESSGAEETCSASSQPKLELPAGFSITLRTVDHI